MSRTWQLRNELWQLPGRGALMGILNVTPDSFSDGGHHNTREAALAHAERLLAEGADVIDIGGESTRPGAAPVEEAEEQRRVLPVIHDLRQKYPSVRLSIDTRNPGTARLALNAGVDIVNDITGLTNPEMLELCAQKPCGIVIMHMKGTPFFMPEETVYLDIVAEVRNFFEERVNAAEKAGISPTRICLDPGIGFNKNTRNNINLIHSLAELRVHNLPLLMGLSRKRFLQELRPPVPDTLGLGLPPIPRITEGPDSATPTVAMSMLAADNGADVHRIHDVAPHRDALTLRYAMHQQVTSGNITNRLFKPH